MKKLNVIVKDRKNVRANTRGITLVSLVVTIIVLIILAGVSINLVIGKNGLITKAQEAKRLEKVAETKEQIGIDILAAQVEAIGRGEQLEQAQIEDIISKYGDLQEDGDTIILNDNGYEVSLLDIYDGTVTNTGSYSELKAKVALLEQQLEDSSKSQSEASKELSDLKTTLAQTTVTEDKMLKDYTAYKDGKLITGTMENHVGQTVVASSTSSDDTNMYLTIPNAGYYDTTSKISTPNNNYMTEIVYADTNGSYTSNTNETLYIIASTGGLWNAFYDPSVSGGTLTRVNYLNNYHDTWSCNTAIYKWENSKDNTITHSQPTSTDAYPVTMVIVK